MVRTSLMIIDAVEEVTNNDCTITLLIPTNTAFTPVDTYLWTSRLECFRVTADVAVRTVCILREEE